MPAKPLPPVTAQYWRVVFPSRDHRERCAGAHGKSTTSGVQSLGAADTSVRATSGAAKLFLRVSLAGAAAENR
jgi:hypothetical protein